MMLKLLALTESEYTVWKQQGFRGEAQAEPLMVMTDETQMNAVLQSSGAIALVDLGDLKRARRL